MRLFNQFILFPLLLFLGTSLFNTTFAQEAPRVKVVRAKTTVKPLNARVLKLNSKAALVLQSWKTAKHMQILRTGHFVPIKNPGQGAPQGGSLPGGSPTNSFASGTNCAKIECPDIFDDDVVCWECH